MIQGNWKRICGLQVQPDGDMAMVWLALDKDTDCIHLYDACMFRSELMAVIAEGVNARGRWIPVVWEKDAKAIADQLLERGCNTLPDGFKETEAGAEMVSRDIQERMRTARFKVDKRLKIWLDEFSTYYRDDTKVPKDSHPLMTATRYAVGNLDWARSNTKTRANRANYPKMAII